MSSAMTRIALLGLGAMGRGMAANIAKAGHPLAVWNRCAPPADAVPRTAVLAPTIADAVRAAELVVTMLADDAAVRAVTLGEGGALAAMAPGAIHVGASTISVALVEELVAAHAARGQHYVAAPVFGRPDMAASAGLRIVAGGDAALLDRCAPLFACIGQQVFPQPTPPHAALAKLLGNFCILGTIEMLAEAFALAEKRGLAPVALHELLTGTLFGSPVVQNYGRIITEQRYEPPGFAMPLGLKDVRLVLGAAEDARVPMPLASLVRDRLLEALAHGGASRDWSAFAEVARSAAGLGGRTGDREA